MHDFAAIEHALQGLAHDAFPEDSSVYWHVRDVVQAGDFYRVEAEPAPPSVGYPRFRFVLSRHGTGFTDHGCYCFDRNAWQLLYTTPGTSDQWKSLRFDGAA